MNIGRGISAPGETFFEIIYESTNGGWGHCPGIGVRKLITSSSNVYETLPSDAKIGGGWFAIKVDKYRVGSVQFTNIKEENL